MIRKIKSKVFFFEKQNRKTVGLLRARIVLLSPIHKSLLLLFFKKEVLASSTRVTDPTPARFPNSGGSQSCCRRCSSPGLAVRSARARSKSTITAVSQAACPTNA
jgi:hypothetical protein